MEDLVAELEHEAEEHSLALEVEAAMTGISPNWNTAPTQVVPVLRCDHGTRVGATAMKWGLVPSWSKDPSVGSKMINARSETITEKPSFRGLVPRNRCIIPMNGFYEWDRHDPKAKVPFFVPRADGHLMFVAGIWTASPVLDDQLTFALITRDSLPDLSGIHDRSPVQLTVGDALEWMCEPEPPLHLLSLDSPPSLAPLRVSSKVNSVRNNGPGLIDPESSDDSTPETLF